MRIVPLTHDMTEEGHSVPCILESNYPIGHHFYHVSITALSSSCSWSKVPYVFRLPPAVLVLGKSTTAGSRSRELRGVQRHAADVSDLQTYRLPSKNGRFTRLAGVV